MGRGIGKRLQQSPWDQRCASMQTLSLNYMPASLKDIKVSPWTMFANKQRGTGSQDQKRLISHTSSHQNPLVPQNSTATQCRCVTMLGIERENTERSNTQLINDAGHSFLPTRVSQPFKAHPDLMRRYDTCRKHGFVFFLFVDNSKVDKTCLPIFSFHHSLTPKY